METPRTDTCCSGPQPGAGIEWRQAGTRNTPQAALATVRGSRSACRKLSSLAPRPRATCAVGSAPHRRAPAGTGSQAGIRLAAASRRRLLGGKCVSAFDRDHSGAITGKGSKRTCMRVRRETHRIQRQKGCSGKQSLGEADGRTLTRGQIQPGMPGAAGRPTVGQEAQGFEKRAGSGF